MVGALRSKPSRRLLVREFVFLVDLGLAAEPGGLLAAERARDRGVARGIGVARIRARGDLFAGDGGGLADDAAAGAAHQVDVNVIVVETVGARRQHGVELLAGPALDVAQESLLF